MKKYFALSLIFSGLMTFERAQAAEMGDANLIAIGQGISSPTSTSTVNFTSGYTNESPVGVVYQKSFRLTGEFDKAGSNQGYGGELGYGNGQAGLAGGYYRRDCSGCEGRFAGSGAVVIGGLGVGLRYERDMYSVAALINAHGSHRFGLMGELNENGGDGNHLRSFGAGYSYVASMWTFTLDASKNVYDNRATYGDRVLVTPGLMVRADFLQLSINDRITLHNRDTSPGVTPDDDTRHDLWAGVGIGGKVWHLAGYVHYFSDVAIAGTLFF